MLQHPFPPLWNADSKVLILGSFPSVKSREQMFFYGHPQNRFWKLLALLYSETAPQTVEEKKLLVLGHGLALWDSIASCEIKGSSDASITDVVPTDLRPILVGSRIERIYCNGTRSYDVYCKYQLPVLGIEAVKLPSTSPANAAWSMERLAEAWKVIVE
ncbi:MAG: DNA-deoxyinosine glycosylase [Firmicutes bacterium]|nr:DNA-deoxyinosine glycosylase [Bacillota bacterium]